MDKEKIVAVAKKNSLSITAGLVAIGAAVALYFPLGGKLTEMQTESDSLAGKYGTISGYATKQRHQPILDPKLTEAPALAVFPTEPVAKAYEDAAKQLAAASKQVLDEVRAKNEATHKRLVEGVLPRLEVDTLARQYARLYLAVLSNDPAVSIDPKTTSADKVVQDYNAALASAKALNLQNDVLKGGLPPTNEEIRAAADKLKADKYVPLYRYGGGSASVAINQAEIDDAFQKESNQLPTKMRRELAQTKMMYVERDALIPSPDIRTDIPPKLPSIWYSQLQLWVQQDVCAGLVLANEGSHNILDAKVKHLIGVQFHMPMYLFPPVDPNAPNPGGGGMVGSPGGEQMPSTADETAALPKAYLATPSGRASNKMYDVVPFRLVIDVDAAQINAVTAALYKARMITVTNQSWHSLDNALEAGPGMGRIYGDVPVVRLTLDCESLFMRSWSEKMMPDEIKMRLGIMPAVPGMPGGNMIRGVQ